MVVSNRVRSFLTVHPCSLVKGTVFIVINVFIINKFPSFLTLVPLKIIPSHSKSGTQHQLDIVKGTNLPFQYNVFPVLTPASPAVPRFLQSKH